MIDFNKFDEQVNMSELQGQIKEAQKNPTTFEDVPAGRYIASMEKMELGETKDSRPMFKVQMRLVDGSTRKEKDFLSKYKNKKPCAFMNRVMFGTKNDANMIASVVGWLNDIGFDETVAFTSYSEFAGLVLDLAEECESLEFAIFYDPDSFNSITVNDVFSK